MYVLPLFQIKNIQYYDFWYGITAIQESLKGLFYDMGSESST